MRVNYTAGKGEFVKNILESGKDLVCFGASLELWLFLVGTALEKNIACVIDNYKQGIKFRIAGKELDVRGLNYLKAFEMKAEERKDYAILINADRYYEILWQLHEAGIAQNSDIYIAKLLDKNTDKSEGYAFGGDIYFERVIKYLLLLEKLRLSRFSDKPFEELNASLDKILVTYSNKNRLAVPMAVAFLSSKCSLRCKHCYAMTNQHKEPVTADCGDVLESIDLFMSNVDLCGNFSLIGGEPFLYKDLDKVLLKLLEYDNILGISFATNGTVLPEQRLLDILKDSRIYFGISDYGNIVQMAKLTDLLDKNNINFNIDTQIKWVTPGGTNKRNKSAEQLKLEFMNCSLSLGCKIMYDRKLFVCDRACRLYQLGVYDGKPDYIDLTRRDLRQGIRGLYMTNTARACDYCDMGAIGAEPIPAGEQEGNQIHRSRYTIIKK